MKFYTRQHNYYCGIDLHTKKMYVCILDSTGVILLHRNIKTDRDVFLKGHRAVSRIGVTGSGQANYLKLLKNLRKNAFLSLWPNAAAEPQDSQSARTSLS